jgi:D-ornithine 4,5-aminomutase subunit alpha
MSRNDDFARRRTHLADLSDEQLKQRFWELADQVVTPLVELARNYTSPSVERSVLLRMGFSSLESKEIVKHCEDNGLIGKGAGHAVWRLAQMEGIPYREAGLKLSAGEGWQKLTDYWQGGGQ